MRLENDDNFNFLYNDEFEKIPFLFRFTGKRYKIALIVMIVFFAAMLVLITVFYSTQTTELVPSVLPQSTVGSYQYVSDYKYGYMVATLICGISAALIAGWMTCAKLLEKRAFKRASKLSNMIFLSETHKLNVEWQNWKMQNRDY